MKISLKLFFLIGLCFVSLFGDMPEKQIREQKKSVVILGGGVGALSCAIYLCRAGWSPVVIEGMNPGGALTQSHLVQNWPGLIEISGFELVDRIRNQAIEAGAILSFEEVVSVDFSKQPHSVITKEPYEDRKRKISADCFIIAMGSTPNYLGVEGESLYWGKGVSNCAICDGSLYRGKTVAVIGGSDAAVTEALYLSNLAKRVYVLVRGDRFRSHDKVQTKKAKKAKNITIFYRSTVTEIQGDDFSVTNLKVQDHAKKTAFKLPVDGVFLAIGSKPNSALFAGQLKTDARGFISIDERQRTSLCGVYAIGDIVDPIYKQAISAAGDGAKAAIEAQMYLSGLESQKASKGILPNP